MIALFLVAFVAAINAGKVNDILKSDMPKNTFNIE